MQRLHAFAFFSLYLLLSYKYKMLYAALNVPPCGSMFS